MAHISCGYERDPAPPYVLAKKKTGAGSGLCRGVRNGRGGGIAVDSHGNIFIAEFELNRVRRVDADTGIITTVAGCWDDGFCRSAGDGGPATEAELKNPESIAVDRAGNLYIADVNNNRIRKVDGRTGTISTIAGDGRQHEIGEGAWATAASVCIPQGVAVDTFGNVFVADPCNQRIRRISTGP